MRQGLAGIFDVFDADFVCLQETKLQAGQIDLEFLGYTSYWNYADKKGYSGTAIFSRHTPLSVTYGIGVDEFDHEGSVITLEMPEFYLVCVYTPNSQDGLKMTSTIAPCLIPGMFKYIVKKYPDIQPIIQERFSETIIGMLKKAEIDMGILVSSLNDPELLEIPLYQE